MLRIEYNVETGIATSDGVAEDLVRRLIVSPITQDWVTSTENVIDAARALIAEGAIPHDQIVFIFKGEFLNPDKDGRLKHWPVGFGNYTSRFLERILNGRHR